MNNNVNKKGFVIKRNKRNYKEASWNIDNFTQCLQSYLLFAPCSNVDSLGGSVCSIFHFDKAGKLNFKIMKAAYILSEKRLYGGLLSVYYHRYEGWLDDRYLQLSVCVCL